MEFDRNPILTDETKWIRVFLVIETEFATADISSDERLGSRLRPGVMGLVGFSHAISITCFLE